MKKFNLRIAHFGLDMIQTHIKAVKNVYGMTIDCQSADKSNKDSYNLADVIFIDIHEGQSVIEEVIQNSASYAEFILYTDPESFKALDEKFKVNFLDAWFSNDTMLDYRAATFIKHMHTIFDCEFAKKKFTVLTDNLPDVIWCKDLNGLHLDANTVFCQNSGKTKEQVLGRDDAYIWNINVDELAAESNDCLDTDAIVIRDQKTLQFDEQVKFDNIMIQYKTYKSCIIGRNGESFATIGLARDVTNIWNTHEDFKKIISRMPIPVMLVDAEFNLVSSNEAFDTLFNYPQEHLENFSLEHFGKYVFNDDIVFPDTHTQTAQLAFTANNGTVKHFAVQKSAIYNVFNIISGYFYIFTDITDDHDRQEHLEKLAEVDELTQINNRKGLRKHFNQVIPTVIEAKKPLAVCMIDIDYFKKYNDFYGHLEGDIIIKKIASIIESIKSTEDKEKIYVARFGGEEFIIVLEDLSPEKVEEIVNTIHSNLKAAAIKHKMSDVDEFVTLSMGIAYYNTVNTKDDISQIMKNADDALYKSKHTGRNKHILAKFN